MFIKNIKWIEKDAKEAEIIISDDAFDILCFSCPLEKKLGEKLEDPLYCFIVKNVVLSDKNIFYVNKEKGIFDYSICGKLEHKTKDGKIVMVNEIKLHINDYIPNDIVPGDYIEFYVSRIDLI